MKQKRKHTSLLAQPGRPWTTDDPLGVILINGTWNYPVNENPEIRSDQKFQILRGVRQIIRDPQDRFGRKSKWCLL
jgi:hypothetical protein